MSLLAWYKLDGNANDSSGNGYNGTVTGATINTTGKIGSAYSFTVATTNNIYTTLPTSTVGNSNFSGSAWVKSSGVLTGADPRIITSRRTSGSSLWSVRVSTSRALEALFWNGTTHLTGAGSTLTENVWYHVSWTYTTGEMKIYLNGVLDITIAGTMAAEFYENLTIGCLDTGTGGSIYSWAGSIDDIRIYNHVLSQKEIEELSRAKVLHYDFNQFEEYTENLYTGENVSLGGGTLTDVGNGWYILGFDASSNGYRFNVPLAKLTNGATYTCSAEVLNQTTSNITLNMDWCDTGGSSYPVILPGERKIVSFSGSLATYTSTFRFLDIGGTASASILIRNIQIEQKDHVTPYTLTGTTRAGTIADKSGYDNHATLTTASPQWLDRDNSGNGCYYFNGMNEFIGLNAYSIQEQTTISLWFNISDTITHQSLISQASGDTLGSNHIRGLRVYDNKVTLWGRDGAGTWVETNGFAISSNIWYHVVGTQNGNEYKLYVNGSYKNSVNTTTFQTTFGTYFEIGSYTGSDYFFNGYIDDVRIYATALSDAEVLELYQTKASVSSNYKLLTDQVIETGKYYTPSQIDYSTWILGSTGSQSGFTMNGSSADNKIVKYSNPNNVDDIVWASLTNDATSDSDGGWDGSAFTIDKTKKYRYSVWARRENMGTGSGYFYFGCLGNSVFNLGTTTKNNNPYFYYSSSTNINNKWVLFVAYIHPDGYAGSTDSTSGGYDPLTKRKIISITTDFKWASDATSGNLRTYLFYSTKTDERQFFYRPRVDIVDGTEPTIQELLELRENPNLLTSLLPSNSIPWTLTNITKSATGGLRKSGGTDDLWGDAQAYSKIGYFGGAYLRFRVAADRNTGGAWMIGLNSDPTTDANYTSIDYCWFDSLGYAEIYESGTPAWNDAGNPMKGSDIYEIYYDNANVYYYRNGTLKRTVATTAGRIFYLDSSFKNIYANDQINEIFFGPTRIPLNLDKYGDFRTTEINEVGIPENPLFYYNFDTIPQIPDNSTGKVYLWNKQTSDGWVSSAGGTLTVSNGTMKVTGNNFANHGSGVSGLNITGSTILKIRARVTSTPVAFLADFYNGTSYTSPTLGTLTTQFQWFTWPITTGYIYLNNLYRSNYSSVSDTLEISDIYTGDGTYSSKVIDGSMNDNHASISGPLVVYEYNGGQAIKATSGTSYLSIAGIPDFSGKSFSMSGWFKKDSGKPTQGAQRLFGRGSYDGTTSFAVWDDNSLGFYYRNTGEVAPNHSYTDGVWVHMAIVVDKVANYFYFYWNGSLYSSGSLSGVTGTSFPSTDIYTADNSILGGNGPAGTIICHYDDLFLYPTALNAAEIKALYDKAPSNFKIMDNNNIQTTELIES